MPAEQFLLGKFRQPRAGGIYERKTSFEIAVVDDVGRLLGELAVPRLAFAQRLFSPPLSVTFCIDDDAPDSGVVEAIDAVTFDVAPRAVLYRRRERVLDRDAGLPEPLVEVGLNACTVPQHQRATLALDDVRNRQTEHTRRGWIGVEHRARFVDERDRIELCSMRACGELGRLFGRRGLMLNEARQGRWQRAEAQAQRYLPATRSSRA